MAIKKIYSLIKVFMLFFITVTCLLSVSYAQRPAQERIPDNYYLEIRGGYGFIIPHHIELYALQTHFLSSEFSVGYLSFGKSRWEYLYHFPRVGLSLWYSGFNNSDYIGKAFALHPYISFPLTGTTDSRLCFRLGVGVGYLTKPYHPVENYKNIAIGSHLNAAINLKLEYQRKISDRVFFNAAADFQHFSNGSMRTPNFGLNSPGISAGFLYHPQRPNPFLKRKLLPELYAYEFDGKKFAYTAFTFYVGIKDESFLANDRLFASAIALDVMKPVSFKHSLGIGMDITRYTPLHPDAPVIPLMKYGINGAWHMKLWLVSFDFNIGVDLFKPNTIYLGTMYEKMAFKYHFENGMFTYFGLKANYGRADFITFGMGYDLKMMYY
ncbi:MAG: acyloxyacyl hydrolase [Bacteroidales bacterium]